jgi:hypothetical protein
MFLKQLRNASIKMNKRPKLKLNEHVELDDEVLHGTMKTK